MTTSQSSILLTHWDPDIYVPQVATPWLQELVLYSLLFGHVVVRDVDIFQNLSIGRHLVISDTDFQILVELVRNGCIEILTLRPESYKGMQTDPLIAPFTARSERHSASRSHMGEKWQPEAWQQDLCLRLDAALYKIPFRYQAPFPDRNDFAPLLGKQLSGEPVRCVSWFKDIRDDARNKFIELCADDSLWESFLLRGAGKKAIVGEGQGFYRTAAYQCAKEFPASERALRNLIQSVYAWCECSREKTEGRYGGRLLWEIPHSYGSPDQDEVAADSYVNIQIVPRRTKRKLLISAVPGIAEILAATRDHPAFRDFQDTWAGIGRPEISERSFWIAYEHLVEAFVENAAKKLVPSGSSLRWHLIASGIALAGDHFGLSLAQATVTEQSIGFLGPGLSRFVRSVLFAQKAKRELLQAVEIRSNKVD
ncbi:MAG: hypothetical protein LAO06_01110 [Acidobacteriia bacterium]|nr:hypothetical protein [Terriglobia bacterium]